MKISNMFTVSAFVFSLGACTSLTEPEGVFAASAMEPRMCSNFGMVDRDNNGIINQAEWGGFRSGVFNDWDMNDDGRLSRAEFEGCWRGGGFMNVGFDDDDWDDNFGAFDDDRDGFLDSNEFFGDDEFGLFDTDNDFGIEPGIGEWGF